MRTQGYRRALRYEQTKTNEERRQLVIEANSELQMSIWEFIKQEKLLFTGFFIFIIIFIVLVTITANGYLAFNYLTGLFIVASSLVTCGFAVVLEYRYRE